MPRISCPSCSRPVALMPLTGRAGYGTVHDHKVHSHELVLCPGSMTQLPLTDALAFQDQLDLKEVLESQQEANQSALFTIARGPVHLDGLTTAERREDTAVDEGGVPLWTQS
ncbi:hypothetical protein P3T36_004850 [Kitasatospora sp. MAP12-15]|uniref:hypothetical protein n=1 Tax=unclassified Kitasatospora TaxID=2633591 RepID=UPI002476A601|nr:hypothetical protein [Kitasatospora sp. MAP12-44]MDH6110218.1 hypothetical protein [Kitasatospora sp. MAP12-44]